MFQQNFGAKDTRWLYWFMAAMTIYGILSLWSENRIASSIGGLVAAVGIGIARYQINKGRRQK